jgi:long-subunit acyl-CoA synthetase (AMP-forming)
LTITDNNNIIKTGDHVEFVSDTDFKFIGRAKRLVRVNGTLHNQTALQILLGKNFPIDQFSLNINQEKLILQVIGNTDQYIEWCQKNHVENFDIRKVDRVATSGGIKTVNNREHNVS